jgi:hypothetical protein
MPSLVANNHVSYDIDADADVVVWVTQPNGCPAAKGVYPTAAPSPNAARVGCADVASWT